MCCLSDLLLLKEYTKVISNEKASDPEPAAMLVSTVAPDCAERNIGPISTSGRISPGFSGICITLVTTRKQHKTQELSFAVLQEKRSFCLDITTTRQRVITACETVFSMHLLH